MAAHKVLTHTRTLTANASNQATNDAQCKEEESYQDANSEWTLEEFDECAFQVGFVYIWLNFLRQFVLICKQIDGIKFVGDFVAAEIVNHAFDLLLVVRILIFEDYLNRIINAIISKSLKDVSLSQCDCTDGNE